MAFLGEAIAQTTVSIGAGSIAMSFNEISCLDAINTVSYPLDYAVYGSMGCVYGGGFVIVSRDFQTKLVYNATTGRWSEVSPPVVVPYFASEASTRYYQDLEYSTVPVSIKRYWKFRPPDRIVNGTNYALTSWQPYDVVGGLGMASDQMVEAVCNTSSGITLTQRAYAFSDPRYDDFIIVEYVFKNTGNINGDTATEYPDNKVRQCYLGIHLVPQPSGSGTRILPGSTGWNAGVDDWIDYFSGGVSGEPVRVLYGWDGDAPSNSPVDDEGDPLPASGVFLSPQYPGMAILHVDRAVNDGTNDPNQPVMTYYSFGGASSGNAFSIRAGGGLGAEGMWNQMSTGYKFSGPFDWDQWKAGLPDSSCWTAGDNPSLEYYKTGTLGFGPYDFLSIGDSVRVVACYAVGSMGWTRAVQVGQSWKRTVDGVVGGISIRDKNRAIRAGRDSLLAKVSRIGMMFRDASGNFSLAKGAGLIGSPLKSPSLSVSPSLPCGDVDVQWEDVGATRYNVYRRRKAVFLFEDDPSELLQPPYVLLATVSGSSWKDTTVGAGRNYWYAVTALDASGLESSRSLNRTYPTATDPVLGSVTPCGTLMHVAVVPNPYDRRSEGLYQLPSNTITFYGLPPRCRIRIFTQSGDLVVTIQHQPVSGNSERWNLLSDSNQYVASGLYIFAVDHAADELGNELELSTVGKFVVVR